MFKFLKQKIKNVLGKAANEIEKTAKEEVVETIEKTLQQKPRKILGLFKRKEKEAKAETVGKTEEKTEKKTEKKEVLKEEQKEELKEKPKEEQKEELKEKPEEKPKIESKEEAESAEAKEEFAEEKKPDEKKQGFFAKLKEKIVTKKISEEAFDKFFLELEIALLENSVSVEVIEKIKEDLKKKIVNVPIKRGAVLDVIQESLRESLSSLFVPCPDFVELIKEKKPFVIVFFGINGSGKTTTIAKVVNLLQKRGLSCVLAASDTFRAASIEQLQEHADKLRVRLIKHDYGGDPAAVAFDAIKHAEAKGADVVLIDTAGRLHSNKNLIAEMEKIVKVAKPDLKIFVGESITGNDAVEQAKRFNESVGIDGIILSKADVDEKGGAAISVSYVTGKPIFFLGVGQRYEDLKGFDKEKILRSLF